MPRATGSQRRQILTEVCGWVQVRQLTDNVVKKQGQIEALSSERSSLALQLEEMERRRRQDTRIQMPPSSSTAAAASRTKFRRGGADDEDYDSVGRTLQVQRSWDCL